MAVNSAEPLSACGRLWPGAGRPRHVARRSCPRRSGRVPACHARAAEPSAASSGIPVLRRSGHCAMALACLTCVHRMFPRAAGATAPAGPAGRPRPAPGMRDGVRAPAPHKHRGSAWDRFLIGWSARHRCAARSSVTEREPPHIGDRYGFRGPRLPIPRDCATESGLPAGFRVGGGQLDRQRRRHQQPGLCAAPARRPRRVIGNMRSTRRERALCPDAISVCLARLGRRGLAGSARRSQCSLSFLRSPSWQLRPGTEVPHRLLLDLVARPG